MFSPRLSPRPAHAVPLIMALLTTLIAASPALALVKEFIRTSGSWHEPFSWNDGVVPGPDDDVIIGLGQFVFIDGLAEARNLTVELGASVQVFEPGALRLTGFRHQIDGTITLNIPGGGRSPGTELRFANTADLLGLGGVVMNQNGDGSRIVVDPDRVLRNFTRIEGIGHLIGRFENHKEIIGTAPALALGDADILNAALIESRRGIVSLFNRILTQTTSGRLRTAEGGRFEIGLARVLGGSLESDGSPGAQYNSSSTTPNRTLFEDVRVEDGNVLIVVLPHTEVELRRARLGGELATGSAAHVEIVDTELMPLSLVTLSPATTARFTDVTAGGTIESGETAEQMLIRMTTPPGGEYHAFRSVIQVQNCDSRGTYDLSECQIEFIDNNRICGAGARLNIVGTGGTDPELALAPGASLEICEEAECNINNCNVDLSDASFTCTGGAAANISSSTLRLDNTLITVNDFATFNTFNSTLTGENQFWSIIDGRLIFETITNDSGLTEAEFELVRAQFFTQQAFALGQLRVTATESQIEMIDSHIQTIQAEFNLDLSQAVLDGGTSAAGTTFNVTNQSTLELRSGSFAASEIAVDNSMVLVFDVTIEVLATRIGADGTAAFGPNTDLRIGDSLAFDVPLGNVLWDPSVRLTATGGDSGVTHITAWLPNRGANPGFVTLVVPPVLEVAAGSTVLLQPSNDNALYFDTLILNAESVLNNANCVPLFIFGDTSVDATAQIIDCASPPLDQEEVAANIATLAEEVDSFPLELMTGPNDNANGNRRASLAQRLQNASGAVLAGEFDDAIELVEGVIAKFDPQNPGTWVTNSSTTATLLSVFNTIPADIRAVAN